MIASLSDKSSLKTQIYSRSYLIPGDPIPLARPRMGQGRVWDSQKQIKAVTTITIQSQHDNLPLFHGSIGLDIVFHMPIRNYSKKRLLELIGTYHSIKPDLDNMVKYICDVSNGVLYEDDCIIASIRASKVYSDNPRTEFTLYNLDTL